MSPSKSSPKRTQINVQQIIFAVFGLMIIFSMIAATLLGR
ncbi:MAG: hypothetical protein OHK0052_23570 [Anaerolineales bacterium]